MSRGRNPKSTLDGSEWKHIFDELQGFYFQYIIIELGRRNKNLSKESAKGLLKIIRQEKDKLVAERKITRDKPLPELKSEEVPFDIPSNWVWCRLGEIVTMIYGSSLTKAQTISGAEFPVFGSNGIVGYYDKYLTDKRAIIIGRKGSSGALNISEKPSWTTDVAYYVEETNSIDFGFLYFLLKSLDLDKLGKGIKPGLNRNEAYCLPIALPPQCEQKMISDFLQDFGKNAIDVNREYFDSEIENKVISFHHAQICNNQISAELNHQLTLVKKLRQAYLREAVQGKLVAQDDRDESAEILLEKIRAEKERLVAEKKIKRDKPLPPIKPEEIPFEIPSNWTWCRLGAICEDTEAGKSPNCKNEPAKNEEWGVIKTTAVQTLDFLENENKVLSNDFEVNPKIQVKQGDVLITRAGPTNRVGIVCYVGSVNRKLILSDKTIRIKYVKDYIFPKFLAIALNSEIPQGFLKTKMVGMAVSQVNISQDNMKLTPLPLPPLAEQERIAIKLEKLMKSCDELEANIKQRIINADRLLQTALKEALESD